LWSVPDYFKILRALKKLPDFDGDARMADAYLCGYWRGIQDGTYETEKRWGEPAKKSRSRKRKPRRTRKRV
jgi:hypothetical protein